MERPALTPIKPTAEYDPEMAAGLQAQRTYAQNIEAGTGRAMEAATTATGDVLESQVAQARAAAQQAGVPFDEAEFRARGQQGIYGAAQAARGERERMLGEATGAATAAAGAQAGERTSRMGIDLQAQQATQEELLKRYGIDVTKYGVDAQAATAANNALMGFYQQLMGGMFNMLGQGLSTGGVASTNYYA